MAVHPSIHSDLTRQHELELRRRLARPGRGAAKPSNETSNGLSELVQAARSRDPQAWESLVTRFSPTLRAVARDYRLSAADVDDVVQEWTGLGGAFPRVFNRTVFFDGIKNGKLTPFGLKSLDTTNPLAGKPA